MKKSPHRLITCIVPKGKAHPVLKALRDRRGMIRANVSSARGIGRFTHLKKDSVGQASEKEVLCVVATCDEAEDVFAFIYDKAEIDRPHGGIMYMQPLLHALPFTLPDIPEEAVE